MGVGYQALVTETLECHLLFLLWSLAVLPSVERQKFREDTDRVATRAWLPDS